MNSRPIIPKETIINPRVLLRNKDERLILTQVLMENFKDM